VHSYKQKTDQASYGEGILTEALNAIRNGMGMKHQRNLTFHDMFSEGIMA